MKRLLFYFIRIMAFCARFISKALYMNLIILAHKCVGVKFTGHPEYIHYDAMLDASGGLTVEKDVVISTRVIILTHDWSFLKRAKYKNFPTDRYDEIAFKPVTIGRNSFVGAGAIVLPGSQIGENCIIGAGAVVKGLVEDNSIIVGNPAKNISNNI